MSGARKESAAEPALPLLSVDRASFEFRRGRVVHITDDGRTALLAAAAELVTESVIERLSTASSLISRSRITGRGP